MEPDFLKTILCNLNKLRYQLQKLVNPAAVLDGLELICGNGNNMEKANQVIQTGWEDNLVTNTSTSMPRWRSTAWKSLQPARLRTLRGRAGSECGVHVIRSRGLVATAAAVEEDPITAVQHGGMSATAGCQMAGIRAGTAVGLVASWQLYTHGYNSDGDGYQGGGGGRYQHEYGGVHSHSASNLRGGSPAATAVKRPRDCQDQWQSTVFIIF